MLRTSLRIRAELRLRQCEYQFLSSNAQDFIEEELVDGDFMSAEHIPEQ